MKRKLTHHWTGSVFKYCCLLLLLLQLSLPLKAQEQKITIEEKSVSLEWVFKEIRKQSGYDFFFNMALIKDQPKMDVSLKHVTIEAALQQVLKGRPLTYIIKDQAVAIKALATAGKETNKALLTISGTVVDENEAPMAGASVSVVGEKRVVYTNAAGSFTLKELNPQTEISISYTGYKSVQYPALRFLVKAQVQLEMQSLMLNETIIQGSKPAQATTKIDLEHRRHLTLAQVLQGTIPGLTIKSQRTSETGIMVKGFTGKDQYVSLRQFIEDAYNASDKRTPKEEMYRQMQTMYPFMSMTGTAKIGTTYEDKGVIPELRGAGAFGGNGNGLLIVIDGFVQENFPADYPMNNVASVEVIKDPTQTIKWGPKAANGVILITTNGGKVGGLQISYNSNFNYAALRDNSATAMQKMNAAELIAYYKAGMKDPLSTTPFLMMANKFQNQALVRIGQQLSGQISMATLNKTLDSLATFSNQQQYRELQQHEYNQNQNLNIAGGTQIYRFALNGNYNTSQNEDYNNRQRSFGLNLRNQLSLLQNKLQLMLLLNAQEDNDRAGTTLDPYELAPFQQLYNADGSYTSDYFIKNRDISLSSGIVGNPSYRYNPLEDARNTFNITKNRKLNSQLNIDWKLLPGLNWSSNVQYQTTRSTNNLEQGLETYHTRSKYNDYYAITYQELLPNNIYSANIPLAQPFAFMPSGNLFDVSVSNNWQLNLRSGLVYSHVFDKKHALDVSAGLAGFSSLNRNIYDPTVYGYNSTTGEGIPLPALPDPNRRYQNSKDADINSMLSLLSAVNLGNRQVDRNFSLNGSLDYLFDGRLGVNAIYNESFIPTTTLKGYASTRNYNVLASWYLHKEHFFNWPFVSKLKLSLGTGQIRMANLDVALPSILLQYPTWNKVGLLVTGYNPVRQNGEIVRNYDALLDLGLFKDVLQGQFNYRNNSLGTKNQLSGRVLYHISRSDWFKLPWVSNLEAEAFVSSMSPGQALAQMMSTNSPLAGGGYSVATGNLSLGALPPEVVNKEVHVNVGLWKGLLELDGRYYHRTTRGLSNGTYQADVSTGFAERALYSVMVNKGYELYVRAKLLSGKGLNWTSTLNAAYNVNLAEQVQQPVFLSDASYLTAVRNGYASDNLWSYRWAGLDQQGAPQVYNAEGKKVVARTSTPIDALMGITNDWAAAGDSWLEYSGRTTAPYTGALIQDLSYKGFFARATLQFNLGHVMRVYQPLNNLNETSSIALQRWQKPGDELSTDIAAMVVGDDPIRSLVIQNSSNSVVSAGFFRLSEVQLGYDVPQTWLKGKHLKSLGFSFNLQNVGLWALNKLGIDPTAVGSNGYLIPKQPIRYGLTLNAGF